MSQSPNEEPSIPNSASWILRMTSAAQRMSVPNLFTWLPGFSSTEEEPARSSSSPSLPLPPSESKAEEPDLSIVRQETRDLEINSEQDVSTTEKPSPLKDMKRCDTYRLVRKRQSFVRKDFGSTSAPDQPILLPGTIVTESEITEEKKGPDPIASEEDTVFLQQNGEKSNRSGEPSIETPPLPPTPTTTISDLNEYDCYGTLIILGYRDVLFNDVTGDEVPLSKMNEDFLLVKRKVANGIRPTSKEKDQSRTNTFLSERRTSQQLPTGSYTITMTIGGKSTYQQSVKIPFEPDEDSDLFQFGRKENCGNDWQISGKHYDNGCGPVSRYAFRIMADRNTRECSVAAGGFDEQGDLFLNHRTIRWGSPPHDAFTTYGLLLRHPGGNWNEVSVLGNMYYLRPSQDIGGLPNNVETNTLKDGSIISIGGTTILYRKGTRREATQSLMMDQLKNMQRRHLICPVEMSTIHFVREGAGSVVNVQPVEAPLIFPSCGHVFNPNPVIQSRTICPCCREEGASTNLSFVHHSGICENEEHSPTNCHPTYVFNPCGHATTEEVVRHWGDLPIPGMGDHIAGEWMTQPRSACPYCGNTLSTTRPYCRIYYP
eukprot:NODE_1107_length_2125_cov_41.738262_g936_i0.p1 GENE.NODE_1107_length_2125_cov_41.738262_g936_i0~~NODE_1107_length_2125_cov_41.738262_g936_i0.p1  ORF type:complete len:600 (-),score=121.85 NODE_1107_length_2125_cov_41.738262_g936_i0:192-1991(-)